MDESEDIAEYNLRITRSKPHFWVTAASSETKLNPVRKSDTNEKYGQDLQKCTICNILLWMFAVSLQDSLHNGQLPTTGQVFSYYLTVKKEMGTRNSGKK